MNENLIRSSVGFAIMSAEQVAVNKDVNQAKDAVIITVAEFLGTRINPIEAINHILLQWILMNPIFPANSSQRDRLSVILELTAWLYKLQNDLEDLGFLEDSLEQFGEKEVQNAL